MEITVAKKLTMTKLSQQNRQRNLWGSMIYTNTIFTISFLLKRICYVRQHSEIYHYSSCYVIFGFTCVGWHVKEQFYLFGNGDIKGLAYSYLFAWQQSHDRYSSVIHSFALSLVYLKRQVPLFGKRSQRRCCAGYFVLSQMMVLWGHSVISVVIALAY